MNEFEYYQMIDEVNESQYDYLKGDTVTIKDICMNLITPMNYTKDTKELTVEVYKQYGVVLERTSGKDLLYGAPKVPRLLSVIRSVQLAKKAISKQVRAARAI